MAYLFVHVMRSEGRGLMQSGCIYFLNTSCALMNDVAYWLEWDYLGFIAILPVHEGLPNKYQNASLLARP